MSSTNLNLIYALKEGKVVHISDVESGLKCGCLCPACGEPLVAKKGQKMMHHFAHHAGHNCEYGYESSLHLAAKDILSRSKKMTIPRVTVHFPYSYKSDVLVANAQEISITRVELEKRFNDVVPDIVVYVGERKFFVEIFVTHQIDENKLKKLESHDISTIEIDLSKKEKTISTEELKEILIGDSEEKTWKYNSIAKKYYEQFCSIADSKEFSSRGYALQIDNCPIASRSWRGKPYANLMDDCLYCDYCIASGLNGSDFLCSGRSRIATIEDFRLKKEERIRISDQKISAEKDQMLADGRCPNCGGQLVKRKSKYGVFWGCNNYPHCRFTASLDPDTGELKTKL